MRYQLFILALGMGMSFGASANPAVKAAAGKFAAGLDWQEKSVLTADFSCAGRKQSAILGTAPREIVVAVFTEGLDKAPELLRFDATDRNAAAARIRLEDSSFTQDEVKALAGAAVPGYKPSKTCKGVRLSDDASDAAHIYWNHDSRKFDSWSQ